MPEDTPSASPPPLPPSPMEKLNDFSDWFSPMLVKELRQGLRTHTFVILFLILQGLLALILLTTAAADTNAGGFVSSIIFFFFSLAVLVVQPLRGMSAISSEVKGDTIDLMSLTRLSAWRIVFGKWSSIMGQTALVLFAIIPYLILRYFFGGMQLFSELLLLFTLFLFSGVLTAVTVGLSASTLALIRAIPLLAGLVLIWPIGYLSFAGFDELLALFSPNSRNEWFALLASYLVATFVGYFFLEVAATTIAPSAENRATRKRLISLVVIPLTFAALHAVNHEPAWLLAFFLLAMVSLDFFTEDSEYPSVVLRPFLRFGPLGRVAARLLAPGWGTGTLFHLFLIALLIGISLLMGDELRDFSRYEMWGVLGVFTGMLYLPHAVVQLIQKRIANRMVAYLSLSMLLFGLIPLLLLLNDIGDVKMVTWVFCFIPHVQVLLTDYTSDKICILIAWVSAAAYILACLISAGRPLHKLTELEREELEIPDPNTPS
ncbi:hypothetical protein [Roseibacillus persicicus]